MQTPYYQVVNWIDSVIITKFSTWQNQGEFLYFNCVNNIKMDRLNEYNQLIDFPY